MKPLLILTIIGLLVTHTHAGNCTSSPGIPNAQYLSGFCGWTFASGLASPRGIEVLPNGDLLVMTRGSGSLTQLWEQADGSTGMATIYSGGLGLNHAVRYYNGSIYASSDTTVYRWNWATPRANLGEPTTVLTGMPAGGNHNTRTLEFKGPYMFVNIGSQGNIDANSDRARIIRVDITGTLPKSYSADSIIYADGTRNVVGLRLDSQGRLWGAENGIDNIGNGEARSDLGNVAQYNPAEEVTIFTDDNMGRFYGYPHCWSEGLVPDGSASFSQATKMEGTQWSTFNTQYTDAWCRNTSNNLPPKFVFQAHSAPLDLIFVDNFYSGLGTTGNFALISAHNVNSSVRILPLDQNGNPSSSLVQLEFLVHGNSQGSWEVKPVAMAYAPCLSYGMCVYFTDDVGGSVFAVALNDLSLASSQSTSSSSTSSSSTSTSTSTQASTSTATSSTSDSTSTSTQVTRSSQEVSSTVGNLEDSGTAAIAVSVFTVLVALLFC